MAEFWGRMSEATAWLKTDLGQAALAGAIGGAIRWITLRERPRDGLVSLLVGSVCAVYAGPLVEPFLSSSVGPITPGGDASSFAAFIVGIGGISLTGAVIDVFRSFPRRAQPGPMRPGGWGYRPPRGPVPDADPDEDFPARPGSGGGANG